MPKEPIIAHDQSEKVPVDQINLLKNYLHQGSVKAAIEQINTLMEQFPRDIRLFNLLAISYEKLGHYQEAIAFCKKGISIFPSSANTYYLMASSLVKLNLKQEAIENYYKTIFYNKTHFFAYHSLGNILLSSGEAKKAVHNYIKAIEFKPDFAEAYSNLGNALASLGKYRMSASSYVKALELKPDYKEARNNLIHFLSFYTPKTQSLNSNIVASQLLQSINFNTDSEKKISDNDVATFYKSCDKIIRAQKINIEWNTSQTYRRTKRDLNCSRHHEVFNTFNIIPEYCFGCYKVQVQPRNVLELFKLFFIFDKLKLKNDLSRKCIVEIRPYVEGSYKGVIYCNGLEEANRTLDVLIPILNKKINKAIPSIIKRGCSEFVFSYPEYKEINQNSPQFMKYNKQWRNKEKIIDDNLAKKIYSEPKIYKKTLSGITLKDVLIMHNWLVYAKEIRDHSYKKITKESLASPFIEETLSGQLLKRINEFSSVQ